LNVGCNSAYVTYADHSSFVTSLAKSVGASTSSAYTLQQPTSTLSYCTPQSTEIVQTDGSAWSGDAKLTGTGSQPYTVFNLVSTTSQETINFKLKTTFPGSFTHISAQATITISCGSSYDISSATATTPQYVTHGDSSVGFTLPAYSSAQQTGCPVNSIEISGLGTSVTTPSGV
jgi:hypothetical protein